MSSISICIPTHHGRRDTLIEAIESVLVQLTPELRGRVEICVSDNASRDGTEERMASYQAEHPGLFVYLRSDRDVDAQRNILQAVRIATRDHCWLLSSDDGLAADSLATVLPLLEAYPDCGGATVAWANFDRSLQRFTGLPQLAFFPSVPLLTRPLEGAETILTECALAQSMLSAQIVRRDLWQEAVSASGGSEAIARRGLFPHLLVIGTIVQARPQWLWCADRLVHIRSWNNVALVEWGWDVARAATTFVADQRRVLADLVGLRSHAYRGLLRKNYRCWGEPKMVRSYKLLAGHDFRSDFRMLVTYTRLFARLGEFWRRTFPLLLVPGRFFKLWRGLQRRTRPLEPSACRVRIEAHVAETMPVKYTERVELHLANLGPARLASSDPLPVYVAHSWHEAGSGAMVLEGPPAPLPRSLRAGRNARFTLDLITPLERGDYELRITLVATDGTHFDRFDPGNVLIRRVQIEDYSPPDGLLSGLESAVGGGVHTMNM